MKKRWSNFWKFILYSVAALSLVSSVCISVNCYLDLQELKKAVLCIEERLSDTETNSMHTMESSYNLADQVSSALGIITAGITVFTLFGGILTIFNISRSKELDDAISKAEKALENQQELIGARLLQDGLVYVSRHRTYYAIKAFKKVIRQAPNTSAALTARYEILSLYADIESSSIDSERLLIVQERFDDLIGALDKAESGIDYEIICHLRGDAYFTLGCAYGQYASTDSPPDKNHIETSIRYLRMATECNGEDVEYRKNLAYTYALAGDIKRCQRELESAIDYAKQDPFLYKPLISQERLRALFKPILDNPSQEMQEMQEMLRKILFAEL